MKNDHPMVSIVILTSQNRTKDLFRCLSSVLQSNYVESEILVVDNNNDSNLGKRIRKVFPSVIYIRMPDNSGIFGFNLGFVNARGKYILILDDDCAVWPSTIGDLIKAFNDLPPDAGVISCNLYEPTDKKIPIPTVHHSRKILTFAGGASVFKSEVLKKTGYFDSDFFCWYHEIDLAVRIVNAGYSIYFAGAITINHYKKNKKPVDFRREIFLTYRNMVWLPIKYFNWFIILLFEIRNFLSVCHLLVKSKKLFFWGLQGFICGLFTLHVPFRKRTIITHKTQLKFFKFLLLNR